MNNILPQKYKVYPFYDDGKLGESRQYLALVTRIIPIDYCSKIIKLGTVLNELPEDILESTHTLKDYWEYNKEQFDWVFAEESDFIIECAVPDYDEHLLYFAKTKKDGWFSLEIQNDWQGGMLDVKGINNEYLRSDLFEKMKINSL